MTRSNHNIYDVVCFQLFYLDRVEFKAEKVDRWFSTALNWTTEKVKKKERKRGTFAWRVWQGQNHREA